MNPEIFQIFNSDNNVKLLLGSNPLRVYPFGKAPKDARKPYAVYNLYNGVSQNYLDKVPDIDNKGVQIDIYGDDAGIVDKCAVALRNSLESHAHMTSFSSILQDADTDYYGFRLEFDFWESRV